MKLGVYFPGVTQMTGDPEYVDGAGSGLHDILGRDKAGTSTPAHDPPHELAQTAAARRSASRPVRAIS
jgi:hypothetical protein